MKETRIEGAIKHIITCHGGWGQKIQSGSVRLSYRNKFGHQKQHMMRLADKGTPDMIFCQPMVITPDMVGKKIGVFLGIEVKKDKAEHEKWLRLKDRVESGEELPPSYDRETAQIAMCHRIRECGGFHLLASSTEELMLDLRELFPDSYS